MSKFTKGKWRAYYEETKYIWSSDGEVLGELYFTTPEETGANSRLIAAAPEMYELLQWLAYGDCDNCVLLMDRARKLLARIDEEAEMTEENIKPCPFCGGEGRIFEDTSFGWDNPLYHVFCGMCLARTDTAYHREDAIKIWNRRANDEV